jgi:hypothetical protein
MENGHVRKPNVRENNIKTDLQERGGVWVGIIWLSDM